TPTSPRIPYTTLFRSDRFQECIGCYICVEVCALLTDYDAVRMYDTKLVEEALGVKVGDDPGAEPIPAEPYEELFSEGGEYRQSRSEEHTSELQSRENL